MDKRRIIFILLSCTFLYSLYFYVQSELRFYEMFKDPETTYSRSWTYYIFPITIAFQFFALLQLLLTKLKRTGLIRVFLLYALLSSLVGLPSYIYYSFFQTIERSYDAEKVVEDHSVRNMVLFVISMCMLALNIYALQFFQKERIPVLKPQDDGTSVFSPVTKWNRFFHRFFDVTIFSFIIFQAANSLKFAFIDRGFDFSIGISRGDEGFAVVILVTFLTLLYYFITEVIFNTTIGKTILGNVIVNNVGEKPSIGQRIGRTFCRLIPFDALSFLFGYRGWHDSITDTYVVKAKKE